METTIQIVSLMLTVVGFAVIMWCNERRMERDNTGRTDVKMYSKKDDDMWQIMMMSERHMKKNRRIAKHN
jgi:hypothetical protein